MDQLNACTKEGAGLHVRGLSKTFPGVRALREMSIDVQPGTVHALLGHNGCGKSTFVKVLAGYHSPDHGCEAQIDGQPLELGSAEAAAALGIRFVHQELGLVLELGAADNIGLALGYKRQGTKISWRRQNDETAELLDQFGIKLDPFAPLSEATPTVRTAVAIVRAVAGWERGRGLLVLDEPTAALPAKEVEELMRIIRSVRDSGTPVLLISHRLDEVVAIADRATVMRSGEVIWDGEVAAMSVRDFAHLIAGAEVEALEEGPRRVPPPVPAGTPPVLQVENIVGRYLNGVSLSVQPGEIVGVAGLLGSGREELPYIVAGAEPALAGRIAVDGVPIEHLDIGAARAAGVALVPADRGQEGIIADFSVRENVTLVALPGLRSGRTVIPTRERRFSQEWLRQVGADPGVAERPITTLSGGNQQKAILARWLSVKPRLLAVSEPTAGIDIGARAGIYEELRKRADEGLAVLMSSSDAEDLIAACDRVIVLRDGAIAADLQLANVSKSAIVAAMEGVHGDHDG
ncbi:MAG: sugar ABC transporter ATP-binding protein [Solirubrobacterales bacterium]